MLYAVTDSRASRVTVADNRGVQQYDDYPVNNLTLDSFVTVLSEASGKQDKRRQEHQPHWD